jgi:hypothetical protein
MVFDVSDTDEDVSSEILSESESNVPGLSESPRLIASPRQPLPIIASETQEGTPAVPRLPLNSDYVRFLPSTYVNPVGDLSFRTLPLLAGAEPNFELGRPPSEVEPRLNEDTRQSTNINLLVAGVRLDERRIAAERSQREAQLEAQEEAGRRESAATPAINEANQSAVEAIAAIGRPENAATPAINEENERIIEEIAAIGRSPIDAETQRSIEEIQSIVRIREAEETENAAEAVAEAAMIRLEEARREVAATEAREATRLARRGIARQIQRDVSRQRSGAPQIVNAINPLSFSDALAPSRASRNRSADFLRAQQTSAQNLRRARSSLS